LKVRRGKRRLEEGFAKAEGTGSLGGQKRDLKGGGLLGMSLEAWPFWKRWQVRF